jgi:uncharacterized protein DUF5818
MKAIFLGLLLTTLMGTWAMGQNDSKASKSKDDVRAISGCLSQGDSANEFVLTAADGSTWELRNSSAVSLSPHVGHEVKVTGTVLNAKAHNMKEDAKDAAKDSGMKKSNAEHGHLKPTDVQMIGDTCAK